MKHKVMMNFFCILFIELCAVLLPGTMYASFSDQGPVAIYLQEPTKKQWSPNGEIYGIDMWGFGSGNLFIRAGSCNSVEVIEKGSRGECTLSVDKKGTLHIRSTPRSFWDSNSGQNPVYVVTLTSDTLAQLGSIKTNVDTQIHARLTAKKTFTISN